MKLRLAKKITKKMLTCPNRYPPHLEEFAVNRMGRTKKAKENASMWDGIMNFLGPEGRAKLVSTWDMAAALDILMRTDESEWAGNKKAWPFVEEPR